MFQRSGIHVEDGRPFEVKFDESIVSVETAIAATGPYVAPGFIDLQVNGFAAVDYNHPRTPHTEIARSLRSLFSTGVTRFFPTVITGPPADMLGALRNLAGARDTLDDGAAMEGFHVEGPHISAEDGPRGAHPRNSVRPPDFDEFRRWQDATRNHVRIVTVAPEWPGAADYIERVAAEGVVVSIGHTQATTAQIGEAIAAGATMSTHLGNGAHGVLPRHPNYIWDQLADDRLTASFIVDGIHLDASFLKVAVRAKTIGRSVLITDAVTPANAAAGRYRIGDIEVDMTAEGRVVLAGQDRLAGSGLRMDRGIEKLMAMTGMSLAEAVRMATVNPARAGRISGRTQGLASGERGDLVEFRIHEDSGQLEILGTWLSGRRVYTSEFCDSE